MNLCGAVLNPSSGCFPPNDGFISSPMIRDSEEFPLQRVDMEIVNETPGMINHEGGILMSIDDIFHD